MSENKLTDKQERFCQEYIIDLNGSAAVIRAGYSEKFTSQCAYEHLSKPYILERIQELKAIRSKRTELTQDMVLKELAKIGFSNMRDYASWNDKEVKLVDSHNLTEDQAAGVVNVSQTITKDGGSIKFKLSDKVNALELLGKHLGLFKEVYDVNMGNCGSSRLGDDGKVIQFPKKKPIGAPVSDEPEAKAPEPATAETTEEDT